MINDYAPALSLAWEGNVDVQYIMSGMNSLVSYVTGYATKSEGTKETELQTSFKEPMTSNEGFIALRQMLRMRPIGTLEMADILLGHPIREFDTTQVFINNNSSEQRHRRLKPKATMEKLDQSEVVYEDNALAQYYPGRHKDLEHYSLFNMMTNMTTEKALTSDGAGSRGKSDSEEGYHPYANPFRHHYHIHNRLK